MKSAHTTQNISPPASWSDLPWGEYYRAALEHQLQPWWQKIFGFHMLKVGNLSAEINSKECPIFNQINVGKEGKNMQVISDPYHLPFEEKSVDACLLSHVLAYSADPHRLLREVDRVMIDDGWLIISGFNSLSLLGLGKLVPGLWWHQPYCSRMFSLMRQLDWLSLLNYEVMYRGNFQVLPWRNEAGFFNRHLPVFGCVSLIIARKRTLPLTLNQIKMTLLRPKLGSAVGVTKCYRKRD
ncbi:class I SAM-dependent methyltransferase [Photorhabdus stackebrandtii]|uniref:SAM-dependent methyltransferase n=1 Tax=Photorhabdus stackebrandtii TaxID=1123042 RepID=A0A7X5TL01_9GAMM|nr:class I SAM-dependent methyltransferase [Photorhabdus stackebrandtii]NHB95899.1 SAM-dependent methyltransferase [Photorhabdus stackebrandtii]